MLLSICIPNYNRLNELIRLLRSILEQTTEGMMNQIEICINDNHSEMNPKVEIEYLKKKFEHIQINYYENEVNIGMAGNFIKCVERAVGEFCWIIGNDDIVCNNAITYVLNKLGMYKGQIDFMLAPWEDHNSIKGTSQNIYPIKDREEKLYHIVTDKDYEEYYNNIEPENGVQGVFGFLSNVIFKKSNWIQYCNSTFVDLTSIFVQADIHLNKVKRNSTILVVPEKIAIRESAGDEAAMYQPTQYHAFVKGIYNLINAHFVGEIREKFFVSFIPQNPHWYARFWDSDTDLLTDDLSQLKYETIDILKKIVIRKDDLEMLKERGVYLFGTGKVSDRVYQSLIENSISVLGYYDNDETKWGKEKNGLIIESPKKLANVEVKSTILIVSSFYKEIYKSLIDCGISEKSIKCIDNLDNFF